MALILGSATANHAVLAEATLGSSRVVPCDVISSNAVDRAHCAICLTKSAVGDMIRLPVTTEPVRAYWKCETCGFIEVENAQHLSVEDETQFYLQHENNIEDPRYRAYAQPIVEEALTRWNDGGIGSCALDYGCGPGPIVASLLRERGIQADFFDPVFFPHGILNASYDLIVACEVVEHFRQPALEFARIFKLLKPGAWFVLQTERLDSVERFDDWYYRRDPTHIAFYSEQTFRHLALQVGFGEVRIIDRKRVSMRKPN